MKVLILAGGKGTRLRPYTLTIPKPLMPVGEQAILEIIVEQLKSYGLKDLIMATGYLSELIIEFFDDGSKYGVKIDYNDLLSFHQENSGILTIALNKREIHIDFGVTKTDSANKIIDYIEKPTIDHLVSMGIYVFDKRIYEYINPGEYLDFPDLVKKLLKNNEEVNGYVFDGYWLDIGRHEDYEKANIDINDIQDKLFGNM